MAEVHETARTVTFTENHRGEPVRHEGVEVLVWPSEEARKRFPGEEQEVAE